MKIFSNLSDTHKERAIHMAEHIVLDGLMSNGFDATPESDEDKEHFAKVKEVLDHAKTLPEDDQVSYMFENETTGDLIFDRAYNLASTAYYIEPNEIAFHIEEIDSHFGDDEDEDDGEEEDGVMKADPSSAIKDHKHLN